MFVLTISITVLISVCVASTPDTIEFSTISNTIRIVAPNAIDDDTTPTPLSHYVFVAGSNVIMHFINVASPVTVLLNNGFNWTEIWKYTEKIPVGGIGTRLVAKKSLEGKWRVRFLTPNSPSLVGYYDFNVIIVDTNTTDHVQEYSENQNVTYSCEEYLTYYKYNVGVCAVRINILTKKITLYNSTRIDKTFTAADAGTVLGCLLDTDLNSNVKSSLINITLMTYNPSIGHSTNEPDEDIDKDVVEAPKTNFNIFNFDYSTPTEASVTDKNHVLNTDDSNKDCGSCGDDHGLEYRNKLYSSLLHEELQCLSPCLRSKAYLSMLNYVDTLKHDDKDV